MSERITGFMLCHSHRALSLVGYNTKSYNHDDGFPHGIHSLPFYGAEIKAFSSKLRFTLHFLPYTVVFLPNTLACLLFKYCV
jgi:hypothetical protein